jgi:hypothetical protein
MLYSPKEFNKENLPFTTNIFQNIIVLYQKALSKGNCQFTPSCSRYSYSALGKYGFVKGSILMFDRLWRCNSESYLYYPRLGIYLFDPLENPQNSIKDNLDSSNEKENFTEWLMSIKEYDSAYRELLLNEYNEQNPRNRLLLAKCSFYKGDYKKAVDGVDGLDDKEATLIKANGFYLMDNFSLTKNTISHYLSNRTNYDSALAGLWLHSFIEDPDKEDFQTFNLLSSKLTSSEKNFNLYNGIKDEVSSNPNSVFSLVCSIVLPGSGQIINGQLENGIYALLFTAGFGFLTVRNIISERYAEATAFGLGFILVYSANLTSAYNAPIKNKRFRLNLLHIELNKIFDPFRKVF